MSYSWPLNAEELFSERHPQMVNCGLPEADVAAVRAAITAMWPNTPGGWVHEWSALASRYADAGSHRLAALAYGWAKFPTLADEAKRTALTRQLDHYRRAAPEFGVDFERQEIEVPHRNGTAPVAVHVLAAPGLPADAPVLLASGGVDTWKMDLHDLWAAIALHTHTRIAAFDIAGTGESAVPMTPDGGAELVQGLIDHARSLGNGVVAHLGVSMGGYYAARSGLAGAVDAAIVLGGPVEESFTRPGLGERFGMRGIIGNALGCDHEPSADELAAVWAPFSLRPLLDQDANAPMLVVNGADDVHVPQHDTLVFEGRRDTEVHLLPDTGHCAVTKFPEALEIAVAWLKRTLA